MSVGMLMYQVDLWKSFPWVSGKSILITRNILILNVVLGFDCLYLLLDIFEAIGNGLCGLLYP